MTALLLLAPGTPMLFQGQEFASSRPFHYFADQGPERGLQTRNSRGKFLSQFPALATPQAQACLVDPANPDTFQQCKLNFAERLSHAGIYAMHRDLLRIRREHRVFSQQRRGGLDGAVLGPAAFVLRYFGQADESCLLIVNFGIDLHLDPAPEPLLAPPAGHGWELLWSSEDPAYGGSGTPPLESEANWMIPGFAAVVLVPDPMLQSKKGH
jgi:maltooligosyltrehalose trehalohydrolase